ncbi:hypothetical protein AAFF_G00213550 [Aldrovandia affinis]|uniref:Tudor domain-containing protein n=1 Tax=Aldrovandia affinis TaxID=143900 RepID=A0AAD7W4W9_9TELE|nr:hypothetical protein AAFF_G00213550 [Aldrovandia affinis]
MPLRFRSFVPYTLPGVLALIGWWWYISRKKGQIASHEVEEGAGPAAVGLLCSPSEGSNGTGERGLHRRSSRGRCRAQEEARVAQEVTAEVLDPTCAVVEMPLRADAPAFCRCDDDPADTGGAAAEQRGAAAPTVTTETEEESTACQGPEERDADASQSLLGAERAASAAISERAQGSDGDPATEEARRPPQTSGSAAPAHSSTPPPPLDGHTPKPAPRDPVSTETATAAATTTVAALPPASSHIAAVETGRLLSPAHENGLAVGAGAGEIERLAAGLITQVLSAAAQEVLMGSRGEGGTGGGALRPSVEVEVEEEEEEGEGDTGGVWEPSSSTPLANGRLCTRQEQATQDDAPTPSPTGRSESGTNQGAESSTATAARLSDAGGEELNGCLAPLAWEQPVSVGRRAAVERSPAPSKAGATPPSLAKLQAEEGGVAVAVAEDSGCSTCQSEDGVSSEDLLHSTGLSCLVPEPRDDLLHISGIPTSRGGSEGRAGGPGRSPAPRSLEGAGLNGTGIGNGANLTGDMEADQSGGSDVNSMDSVDSGCTLGAADSQHSGTQSSELIIWEIEVPKHLVGRLIGKQGRYVSFLKQSSGAKIYISTLPYTQEFQICHIEGTQQQVDKALALIGKKFKDLDLTNLYAPPPLPLTLPSLPMTSWLLLPNGVTVEVIVVNIVSAGHVFVQQHTHPTYHALRSLDQQMFLCYSQPGTPALPSPAEVGVICAAPAVEGAWWRAQVISFYKDSNEVEIRYVDYGGYDRVKIDTLRQIRSDFVTLPFQGAEVLLDNIAPLPGEERFSTESNAALEEMTRGVALLAQVTNYDNNTGLPLVQMWNMVGEELVSVNRTLAERGFGTWVDSF